MKRFTALFNIGIAILFLFVLNDLSSKNMYIGETELSKDRIFELVTKYNDSEIGSNDSEIGSNDSEIGSNDSEIGSFEIIGKNNDDIMLLKYKFRTHDEISDLNKRKPDPVQRAKPIIRFITGLFILYNALIFVNPDVLQKKNKQGVQKNGC